MSKKDMPGQDTDKDVKVKNSAASELQKSKGDIIKIISIAIIVLVMSIFSISLLKKYRTVTSKNNHSEKSSRLPEFVIFGDIKLKICGDEFSHDVLREKTYDDEVVTYLRQHLKRGDTVVEVDHGIGAQTLLMAKITEQPGRIYSFNPCAQYVDAIKESAAANRMESRIFVNALAISNHSFDGLMVYKNNFPVMSGRLEKRTSDIPTGHSAMIVKVSSIDEQLPHLQNINFLKINSNGSEANILSGATNIIMKSEKIRIIFSYDGRTFGDTEIIQTLMQMGFNLHIIQKNGLIKPLTFEELMDEKSVKCHLMMSRI